MNNMYDVIIIGAGPIGISCGVEAVKCNKKHLILDKGCIVNSLFNYPVNMTFFSTSDRIELGDIPFVSHGDKPTRREALEYFRRIVACWKLNVHTYENVKDIIKEEGKFTVVTKKESYETKNIIIATGFYDNPNYMNIPGEELPKVRHYFTEAHPFAYQNVVVIGGGNSGIDVALETFRKEANVTLVIKEDGLKPGIKYWVKPDIENRINEGSIKAFFNSNVIEIKEKSVIIETPEGQVEIPNDFVFAMTGYHSDFNLFNKAGIAVTGDVCKTPCYNPDTLETNVPGIFLAGVVLSGSDTSKWFIENSRDHGEKIFKKIISG